MLTRRVGESLLAACENWANTKASYRFLSNNRVTEKEILAGHFASTARRVLSSVEEPIFSQTQIYHNHNPYYCINRLTIHPILLYYGTLPHHQYN